MLPPRGIKRSDRMKELRAARIDRLELRRKQHEQMLALKGVLDEVTKGIIQGREEDERRYNSQIKDWRIHGAYISSDGKAGETTIQYP